MSAIPYTEGYVPPQMPVRPEVRLLVCGGRRYDDRERVYRALGMIMMRKQIVVLMHGGATGADALADDWANERGFARMIFPVGRFEWSLHGRFAGPMRNQRMLRDGRPTAVVAFPGGAGTAGMCKLAEEAGLKPWRPFG